MATITLTKTQTAELNTVYLSSMRADANSKWGAGVGERHPKLGVPADAIINSVTFVFSASGLTGDLTINGHKYGSNVSEASFSLPNTNNQDLNFRYVFTGSAPESAKSRTEKVIDMKIFVDYTENKPVEPPMEANLSAITATVGTGVTLSWSGQSSGSYGIDRTRIQWSDSTDGTEWSEWTTGVQLTGDQVNGPYTVYPAATVGMKRRFRIRAEYGSTEFSEWMNVEQKLTTVDEEHEEYQVPVRTMMPHRVVHIWRRVQ